MFNIIVAYKAPERALKILHPTHKTRFKLP